MAAGRNLIASFILRLVDRLSPGLQRIQGMLQRTRDMAGRIGAIGAVVAGISFMAPLREAAAFDDVLRQTAITAGQSGRAAQSAVAQMSAAYQRLALETGQRSQAVAQAAADLQAANLAPEVIQQLLPTLARTATATGAELADLTRMAIGLNQNLRIGPDQMAVALARMAQAGKEGRFELRDMAREFPALTAGLEGLGATGLDAAERLASMLQVARRGAATGSEAATNLSNLISKISSPETVRNFAEAGTNLPGLLASAAQQGINPVEAVIQEVRRLSRGDMFSVGRLFGDQQVLNALRPFMTGTQEYLRILQSVRAAQANLIDTDFETRRQGLLIRTLELEERITQLGRRVGNAFGDNLGWINDALAGFQAFLDRIDAIAPGLVDNLLMVGGAGILLAGALGVLGVVAPAVAAGVALIGGPIGLAALAIAAAAVFIWQYWNEIGEFFSGLWAGIQAAFSSFGTWLASWVSGDGQIAWLAGAIRTAWAPLGSFFDGLLGGIARNFEALMSVIRPVLDGAQRLLGGNEGAGSDPAAQAARRAAMGNRGSAGGFYADPVLPPAQRMQGEIVVRAEPGTAAEVTRPGNRDVPLTTAPNRGPMLGLP
jgi:hypothetical protein